MKPFRIIHNEEGTVLFISILILLMLTVIGFYAMGSTTIEVKISGHKRFYDEAFNAANGGIDYVLGVNPFISIDWTNNNWSFQSPENTDVNFSGTVTYLGATPPPVGSGTGLRAFKAHHYKIDSTGTDPSNIATTRVQVWGYRIGL